MYSYVPSLVAFIFLVFVIIAILVNSGRRQRREYKMNFAVNNSIADLIEDKAIIESGSTNHTVYVKKGSGKPRNLYAKRVYEIGFGKTTKTTAKQFHELLYVNRVYLRDSLTIVPPSDLDFETSPKSRTTNNETLAVLLPLLILGDENGASGKAANDSYAGDTTYVGAHTSSSDCDGGSSSGGDSGGGDGGGGGGD